jgi:hypothetical protein
LEECFPIQAFLPVSNSNSNCKIYFGATHENNIKAGILIAAIKKQSDEISELLGEQRFISTNKSIRHTMTYLSTKALALSWITGVGSAIGASQNLMIQASEGRYFNLKQVRKAQKMIIKGDEKSKFLIKA